MRRGIFMKDFTEWFKESFNEDLPEIMDRSWFSKRGLPMIVSCTECDEILSLPSTRIDEYGHTYCRRCGHAAEYDE